MEVVMYCGGGPPSLVGCPCCKQGWSNHARGCKYDDPATRLLNARNPVKFPKAPKALKEGE